MDGRALAEELGVRRDLHIVAAQGLLDDPRGPNGHSRLIDDDGLLGQHVGNSGCRLTNEAQVCRTVGALWRGDAQVAELAVGRGGRLADDEGEVAAVEARTDELLEARLPDRHLAPRQQVDAVGKDVGTDDLVAEMRETSGGREADISGPEDGDATHAVRRLMLREAP